MLGASCTLRLGGAVVKSCMILALSADGQTLVPVKGCRTVRKTDMLLNNSLPTMEIDAQTYEVRADGELLRCEPATSLPLAQRYFLF